MNDQKGIWGISHIHPELNARDARLKIRACIKQTQNECKGVELSAKIMVNILHKVFRAAF